MTQDRNRRRGKRIPLAAVALWALLAVSALAPSRSSAETLTAERAVQLALANNLGLAAERVEIATRKLVRDTAWNSFIPAVSASATLARRNEAADTIYTATQPRWNLSLSLTAQLPLTAALANGIRQTVLDYENGLLSLETAERQMERDVRKSFYNLIVLRENMALAEQSIANAQRRYEQARTNYLAGLVPEYTVLAAQVSLENLKPQLEEIRNGYETALASLKLTLGLPREVPLEIEGSLEATPRKLDAARLIETRIPHRLDIRSLDAALASLRNAEAAKVNQRMTPSLTLSFLADPTYLKDPFEGGWLRDTEEDWTQSRGAFALTLTMPLDPLLPLSSTRIELAKLHSQIRQMELRREQAVRAAEVEIASLVRNLDRAASSIATLRLNVALAQRAYRLAEEAYNAGSRELLEVQNAELELSRARLEVLKAQFAYTTALLDLEYALNMSLAEEGS